jgi:hypothetical protein
MLQVEKGELFCFKILGKIVAVFSRISVFFDIWENHKNVG